jgi:hypothetical protein
MKYLAALSICLTFFSLSCNSSNKFDAIEVKGIILDSQTGKAIPNARVTLLCWRNVRFDEETYEKVDTITDSSGVFKVRFKEGFKVDVGSIATNYHPSVLEIKDINNASKIQLKLHPNNASGLLKQWGQLAVFVREYETEPSLPKSFHGINLLEGTNTQSSDSMDVGIMQFADIKYPKILVTSFKGGIIPFFENSKSAISKAPEDGYVTKYELQGNEGGFFVRCRDGRTYARLIIFSVQYDRTTQYRNGFFRDYGIMFNADLQTQGREFNNPDDLRLDYYILENI